MVKDSSESERHHSPLRRTKNWDCLALVSSKDLKVSAINSYDGVLWEQFAHSHQAQVGKVRLLVRISSSQTFELNEIFAAVKRERNQALIDHRQSHRGTLEVKCGLRKHSLASQKRFGEPNRNLSSPPMVFIVGIRKRHQKPRIGNALHEREKPLRVDRSRVPCTEPASLINDGDFPLFRALSSCSRTMRPLGIPVCFEA